MEIAIIGAGFTGLTAAYKLSQKKHKVFIFEKGKSPGGIAAGFREKNWRWYLEYFYHHLFPSDEEAKKLISELNLSRKLFYLKPKTSIFYQKKISQFDSPLSLLNFPFLSFKEKLQAGFATFYLKTTKNWKKFENISAQEWLKKYYGEKPYKILWEPLLKAKFGNSAPKISMSWFWARIKKRSQKLGYLEGGFQTLINALIKKIKENDGEIKLNRQISSLNDLNHFNKIIVTVPNSEFYKIIQKSKNFLSKDHDKIEKWARILKSFEMFGALNLILVLKKQFLTDNTYWLSINEKNFPFVALVEHTNFIDKKHYGGNYIVYLGGYYPQNHPYFKMEKEEIFKKFLPYLQKINPRFDFSKFTIYYLLFTAPNAQPLIPLEYSKIILPHKTPIPNVYLANMQQIYPWDRGINYAIEEGEKIANEIENF